MKWFRHISNASDNDFIEGLEDEFGLAGYARWFKLLEVIAIGMDKTDKCHAEHTVDKWCGYLKAKRKIMVSFLFHCENKMKIKQEQNGNIIKITCPKLLELRDDYTRKSGHCTESLRTVEAEADNKKEYNLTSSLPNSAREKIPIPSHNLKPKKDFKNDFEIAAAACCALLHRRSLSPVDADILRGWCKLYDFEAVKAILVDKATTFSEKNNGASPASLSYFCEAVKEKIR